MKLHFSLPYRVYGDETLCAVLLCKDAQGRTQENDVKLHSADRYRWEGETEISLHADAALTYHYEVRSPHATLRREWTAAVRIVLLSEKTQTYFLNDLWRDLPAESWLYSSALAKPLPPEKEQELFFNKTLVLRAAAARLAPGQKLFVCGADKALGEWNPSRAVPMHSYALHEWTCTLNAEKIALPCEYKFIAKTPEGQILWEEGPNRTLAAHTLENGEVWAEAEATVWTAYTPFRAAGVVLPVFSIRTQTDGGCGDFGSLKKLADWAAATGQKVIQILPVNDTSLTGSWTDSYPYNALSVYAFHPMYTDVTALPALPGHYAQKLEKERQQLNALPQVDYERVNRLKRTWLRAAFKQEGSRILKTREFEDFFNKSRFWLPAYAMFCVLRDEYQTADFTKWPKYARFSPEELARFCAPGSKRYADAAFYYYMQYILHVQSSQAVRYAREKGIILKGDIPIGISPHSAEAWTENRYFNLNAQAGAPPDDFSATGQNWGFPTYNWNAMARDGYQWWQRRFAHMARYFDAYRIDHVLGFFRIWEIPSHSVEGLLGQFSPALPMSRKEVENYGLPFKEEYLQPYISDSVLAAKFGTKAEEIKKKYLTALGGGRYALLPHLNTQRKIEAAFAAQKTPDETVKKALYALVSNVLFVPDRTRPEYVHPRISAPQDAYFAALTPQEQAAFQRLYDDYFYRRHNDFWREEALKKLPALTQSTHMLCCAEDLGMIPACVPDVMSRLQMLSLEIQRMPKRLGETFADTKNYPYLSAATPGTHDMSVLRGWWKESPEMTRRFYNEVLGYPGPAPQEADGKICEDIIRLHLNSPSMLALIAFQDWISMDEALRAKDPDAERINVPANPRHYWRYRMHIPLEELIKQTALNEKIKRMIQESGR